MSKIKFFSIICILIFLSSCGYSVRKNITPVSSGNETKAWSKIIILPLADYSSSSLYESWKKNLLITEALQDEFLKVGFVSVPYEDVVQYLLDKGIIKGSSLPETGTNKILLEKMGDNWSPSMKAEFWKAIEHNRALRQNTSQKTLPLDAQTLKEMGHYFGAHYIVRGRILAFNAEKEQKLNPFKTGLLPFVFQLGSRTIFGVANSSTYEVLDQMATGAVLGAGIGALAGGTVEMGSWLVDSSVVGGATGAGAGLVATGSGKSSVVRVQVRLFIQDVETGALLWSNRAEIEVSPESVFSSKTQEKLFAKAAQEVSSLLVGDFSEALQKGNLPLTKEAMYSVEEAKKAAEEAKAAAEAAKAAAEAAAASAVKSERIFEKTLTK